MEKTKTFKIDNYVIELIIPDTTNDLRYSSGNNINVYNRNGSLLWNISELLKTYSNKNHLKYFDELYFDIHILDEETIFCIGYYNHCEIDLKSRNITKIVNNR